MLQGVKAVISQFRGIWMPEDAKDPAVMFRINLHQIKYGSSAAMIARNLATAQAYGRYRCRANETNRFPS